MEKDNFGLFTQGVIQSWLMKVDIPKSIYSLPSEAPRDLFRVIDGLRVSIMQVNPDWPLLHHLEIRQHSYRLLPRSQAHTLTPYQSYCLYATAFKGIINWPMGFHQFLSVYREREKKSRLHNGAIYNGLSDELGTLYSQWINKLWKHAAMEFVQQAFHQYLADNHSSLAAAISLIHHRNSPEFVNKLHYITINDAKKLLGTSFERLKPMIRSRRLKSYTEQGKSRVILLKREDVLELGNRWKQAIGLSEVADRLGLSKKVVLQLVQIGMLTAQQSYTEGFYWIFSPSDVTECLELVTSRASSFSIAENSNREDMLSLMKASKLLQIKIGSGAIAYTLQKVANGSLRAYISENSKLQLGTLLFTRSDIDMYIETVKAENGWIDRDEVTRILGIDVKSLVGWVRTGLISPVIAKWQTHYFDKQTIEKLKSTLVLTTEASKILGVNKKGVHSLIRQGRLKALRGPAVDGSAYYVFSRDSLLEWKNTRATLKEASRLLHVSEQKLLFWVAHGIGPLPESEKQKPWFFSIQALHSYKESEQECSPSHNSCTYKVS